jgi:starch phosphorylase
MEVAMEIALPPNTLEKISQRFEFRPTRDAAMSTSVGGIGPLLRERIMVQADEGIEVIGVTLLYQTTWIQSWFEWGQLHLEKREVAATLREILKDTGLELTITMFDGTIAKAHVWQAEYGKAKVYFLDAPPLTQVVYPSDEDAPHKHPHPNAWAEDIRYRQSWLIGRGSLALAKALGFIPEITIQSETPTFFAHHRLIKDEFQNDPFFAATRYIFNDHTPMEYAHPVWSQGVLAALKVDASTYVPPAGVTNQGDVDVTRLLIATNEGVFGVAKKHGRVMRAMPSLKEYDHKIESITNGVHVGIWQAPEYDKAASLSDSDLLKLKKTKKNELLDWVWRHYGLWHTWKEQVVDKGVVLWTRRITGYKRIDLLGQLCKDPTYKRQFLETNLVLLIGGRIHQHDDQAQTMIYNLLDVISQDPLLQERVVFLDNFNVWMAPHLFQGADAAIMLADDGREASATGFMKAQVNGGLILATDDGAIPESVIFQGQEKARPELPSDKQAPNGFEVPYYHGHPRVDGLIKAFKQLHQALADPAQHAAMVRSALAVTPQVSVHRTVDETLAFYHRMLTPTNITPAAKI